MTAKPMQAEVSAYAAGAVFGAFAMFLALWPHLRPELAAAAGRVSPAHAAALQPPAAGRSLYAAAKVGLPPDD